MAKNARIGNVGENFEIQVEWEIVIPWLGSKRQINSQISLMFNWKVIMRSSKNRLNAFDRLLILGHYLFYSSSYVQFCTVMVFPEAFLYTNTWMLSTGLRIDIEFIFILESVFFKNQYLNHVAVLWYSFNSTRCDYCIEYV